jgi:uncharacterized protein YggE
MSSNIKRAAVLVAAAAVAGGVLLAQPANAQMTCVTIDAQNVTVPGVGSVSTPANTICV